MNILDKKKENKLYMNCSNCGSTSHEYKFCKEPITSWGIVLVKIHKSNAILTHDICANEHALESYELHEGIKISTVDELSAVCTYMKAIQFLLVRRKHSLGYMEFVRGKYVKDNIDGITYLFQQMTPDEITKLKTMEFDDIWNDMWGGDVKKISLNKKEYIESKYKFDCLKNKTDVELPLNFYVKNIKPYYDTPEWGFPKGRKSKGESDLECAIREFCEETGYEPNHIKILSNIKPITENIIGTNGISYRHIYFLAEDISDNVPSINDKNSNEIGNIGYFVFDDAYEVLREYHLEKRSIIRNVFMYFINELTQFDHNTPQNDHTELTKSQTIEKQPTLHAVASWSVDTNDIFFK